MSLQVEIAVDNSALVERLRKKASLFATGMDAPYGLDDLLEEAAEVIEYQERELNALYEQMAGENI